MAGICLIRLQHIRPAFVPWKAGIRSENAAHRFAVEWEHGGELQQGVFIPRRDTSSRLNSLVGGRLFPGEHHHAQFDVSETDDRFEVSFESDDRQASVSVKAQLADQLPTESVFASVDEASRFFEGGSLGYSATRDPKQFDGLELRCQNWSVQPLAVNQVKSSFFDDRMMFPSGSAVFDCALLMRGIQHQWHSREDLCST